MERRKLTDILGGSSSREKIRDAWEKAEVAVEMAPLPSGEYVARIANGELHQSRNGTAGYKLTFKVVEGDFAGRRFWADLWLTPPAMAMTKRDLIKLGVTSLDQLERPLPEGIRCRVKLALRKSDDGAEYNRVRSFEVITVDGPEPNPFPPDESDAGLADGEISPKKP